LGLELADMKTIMDMALESGFSEWAVKTPQDLERFAALVRADEREECAKVCEGINSAEDYYGERPELVCAAVIRARGNT
jgi:hypothetical protein